MDNTPFQKMTKAKNNKKKVCEILFFYESKNTQTIVAGVSSFVFPICLISIKF
jgi:hypothetical protein